MGKFVDRYRKNGSFSRSGDVIIPADIIRQVSFSVSVWAQSGMKLKASKL